MRAALTPVFQSTSLQPSWSDEGDGHDTIFPYPSHPPRWRAVRAAWTPAFQSSSLERYSALMDDCALKLCDAIGGKARRGEVVDLFMEFGKLTMSVRGGRRCGGEGQGRECEGGGGEGTRCVRKLRCDRGREGGASGIFRS